MTLEDRSVRHVPGGQESETVCPWRGTHSVHMCVRLHACVCEFTKAVCVWPVPSVTPR